ncbi:EamA family transporter [Lipingzhangella sp. LS1_29]|uniref:EamA family transporter n=1 Tax=Lipingzhangella rawalii TaxID=2055835 RepID=A0ABU2H1I9_9ACTN|nr:EamA family transporter [Lipingzhangella rawalii]MDS1269161.1 EamA family transporter [Lipingzhangella rawalii]
MTISPLVFMQRIVAHTPPALLLVAGMVLLHTGSAFAVHLFDPVGPAGVTWLRLSWAALLLLALTAHQLRSILHRMSRRDLAAVLALGLASAGMTLSFSESTARIPLGTANALEFLGPLAVALLALRRRRDLVWVLAAALGVALLTRPWSGAVDLVGVGYGLAAASCLALYILLGQRVGTTIGVVPGLALSMAVASLASAPLGAPQVVHHADLNLILATLGIALLFPLLPFLIDLQVLQRMRSGTYGTLISLEPAVSLTLGGIILTQIPVPGQLAGLALVILAGIGAARSDPSAAPANQPGRDPHTKPSPPHPSTPARPAENTPQPLNHVGAAHPDRLGSLRYDHEHRCRTAADL